jgi:hypothetical protein
VPRKKWARFPGLKKNRSFKTQDSHFSSGKPDRKERKEWADWHKGYKEKDYFKARIYLIAMPMNSLNIGKSIRMRQVSIA